MKTFNNIGEFTNYILNTDFGIEDSLDEILEKTQKNIRDRHGKYPTDVSWKQLKASTIKMKKTGNSPLLETGELRASYKKRKIRKGEGEVVSNLDKAKWMEYGVTKKGGHTPARPVVRPEAIKAEVYTKKIVEDNLKQSLNKKLA